MTSVTPTPNPAPNSTAIPLPTETVELSPSYRVPLGVLLIGASLLWGNVWVGGAIALFGIFLVIQAATLRLRFTDSALDVYRGDKQIRHFPYEDWQNWRIFWSGVPILFYFKEIKSIHFLPVLFNPKALRSCLEQRCPYQP